jgi:hypothetical protein
MIVNTAPLSPFEAGRAVEKTYNCRADTRVRREENESFAACARDIATSVM